MKIKKLFALSFVAVGITALASCGDKQFTEEDVNNKVNEAVDKARSLALEGDIITLSPACASFDMFPNFVVRGNEFKALVNELK